MVENLDIELGLDLAKQVHVVEDFRDILEICFVVFHLLVIFVVLPGEDLDLLIVSLSIPLYVDDLLFTHLNLHI
jgi:hypothetical protein